MNTIRLTAPRDAARLDAWLATEVEDLSRARIQALIREGCVTVDGQAARANRRVRAGQTVVIERPDDSLQLPLPEDIALDIRYEDEGLMVLNKPAGLVIHPAPGHSEGTLVNALLHHCPDLHATEANVRPGIVHRLDRDTSGVMMAAKTEEMTRQLIEIFKERSITKEYLALVRGVPDEQEGSVQTEIGRDPRNRKRMSTQPDHGKPALTHYRVEESHEETALVRCRIETGRTHQIRVHMAHIGTPVLGDALYGGTRRPLSGVEGPSRQMLHAARLAFKHPLSGDSLDLSVELPDDIVRVMNELGYRCLS